VTGCILPILVSHNKLFSLFLQTERGLLFQRDDRQLLMLDRLGTWVYTLVFSRLGERWWPVSVPDQRLLVNLGNFTKWQYVSLANWTQIWIHCTFSRLVVPPSLAFFLLCRILFGLLDELGLRFNIFFYSLLAELVSTTYNLSGTVLNKLSHLEPCKLDNWHDCWLGFFTRIVLLTTRPTIWKSHPTRELSQTLVLCIVDCVVCVV